MLILSILWNLGVRVTKLSKSCRTGMILWFGDSWDFFVKLCTWSFIYKRLWCVVEPLRHLTKWFSGYCLPPLWEGPIVFSLDPRLPWSFFSLASLLRLGTKLSGLFLILYAEDIKLYVTFPLDCSYLSTQDF